MQAQRRSFHTSPANQRSCLACSTLSRHSICKGTVRFAPKRRQESRRAYTSAMAGWPLLGLGRHCSRHVGTFLCRRQRPGHRQRRRPLRGKPRSMPVCRHLIYLFQYPLRHSVLSMKLDTHSCPNWNGVSRQSQTIPESLSIFSSASSFSYKGF